MGNKRRNHVVIEMNEVLAKAKPVFTTECCIYRVPRYIRNLNPGAYTPNLVSIGPLHYGDNNLQSMESQKQFYCRKFIERAMVEKTIEELMSCVQELEPRVRACYSDNIKLTPQELVKVIFVDCGFIFELFLRDYFNDRTYDDAIPSKPWLTDLIRLDLVLLENQLPFFVLEELYNLAFASRQNDSDPEPSFLDITFDYFSHYNKLKLSATASSIKHFTDLLRTFHLQPSKQRPLRGEKTITRLNSATELNEAGVKFEAIKQPESNEKSEINEEPEIKEESGINEESEIKEESEVNEQSHCLLKLENVRGHRRCYLFKGPPRLKIPQIIVEDETEILFRNMVALEQCHYSDQSYITDYVAFMSFLVKTGKDVDLLVKKEIIVNWLGENDAVAKLFNGLWKNIIQEGFNSDYLPICEELNKFCEHPWYSRKATLRRDYCNTTWKKVATIAAILVIILTIIQTVCSILQVV